VHPPFGWIPDANVDGARADVPLPGNTFLSCMPYNNDPGWVLRSSLRNEGTARSEYSSWHPVAGVQLHGQGLRDFHPCTDWS
jgi:hypothetical protein